MGDEYDGREYVGLDLHRRRTVMVRMTPVGETVDVTRFASDPGLLVDQIAQADAAPQVVLEATGVRTTLKHIKPMLKSADTEVRFHTTPMYNSDRHTSSSLTTAGHVRSSQPASGGPCG